MRKCVLLLSFLSMAAIAQTRLDLQSQTKRVDFTAASSTKPVKAGTSLPALCSTGELFFSLSAPPGENIYGCVSTNTWALQSSGDAQSGGSVTVQSNGVLVGAKAVQNFIAGAGMVNTLSTDGTRINIQTMADTAILETRANVQAGLGLFCNSAGGSTTTYTCRLSPALSRYTRGMVLRWVPDVTVSGSATLNVDTLGATPVKRSDGVTNLQASDVVAGRLYDIWFDGTVFRLR